MSLMDLRRLAVNGLMTCTGNVLRKLSKIMLVLSNLSLVCRTPSRNHVVIFEWMSSVFFNDGILQKQPYAQTQSHCGNYQYNGYRASC